MLDFVRSRSFPPKQQRGEKNRRNVQKKTKRQRENEDDEGKKKGDACREGVDRMSKRQKSWLVPRCATPGRRRGEEVREEKQKAVCHSQFALVTSEAEATVCLL